MARPVLVLAMNQNKEDVRDYPKQKYRNPDKGNRETEKWNRKALSHVAGPLGLADTDDGLFPDGTLGQSAQPRYDTTSPGAPGFYAHLDLAPGDVRIIEAPALVDRRALVFRNYYLRHRKDVLLGFFTQRVGVTGPYIPLLDARQIRASGADYLVYHRNIEREVRKFWETIPPVEREVSEVEPPTGAQVGLLRAMLGSRTTRATICWSGSCAPGRCESEPADRPDTRAGSPPIPRRSRRRVRARWRFVARSPGRGLSATRRGGARRPLAHRLA